MNSVVNGHRERDPPPTPRYKADQGTENEYEQPTYDRILDL